MINPENQRCVRFMDDSMLPTCRPGDSIWRRENAGIDIQKCFFNGWKNKHGLKAQTIMLPDGMWGNIYIMSMRNNDNGLFNMSGIGDYLAEIFPIMDGCEPNRPIRYAIYSDGILQSYECVFNRPLGSFAR